MKGCAYWRLYECVFTDDERGMLPSNRFASMWMAEGRGSGADTPSVPQWIAVDLGRPVAFDTLRLSWRYPAIQGRVQASDDAQTWRDVASLFSDEDRRQEMVTCRETARYVRLLLERPGSSGLYALSELEVWGRPATPAPIATPEGVPTVSLQQGKRCPLTKGWELRRDGYDRWLPATVPGTVLTSFIHNGAVRPPRQWATCGAHRGCLPPGAFRPHPLSHAGRQYPGGMRAQERPYRGGEGEK